MGRTVEGRIEKHQDLKRFTASTFDIAAKDQIDLMSRCWFSLTADRTDPIEHNFVDSRSKRMESVKITGTTEHGIATIHDQDLLIFVISQWIEAKSQGAELTRRVSFTPYQFFTWMNKVPNGKAYKRLKDALTRLRTTTIETTIRSESSRRERVKQFSWISEWEVTEDNGQIRGVEVVLAEWLFDSIQDFHVLTLDKRYFDIVGPVERWLYLYARKATGGPTGQWKEGFRILYEKSASQQEYKHYANALRRIVRKNNLPGLRLETQLSIAGKDMLVMQRTEKRQLNEPVAEHQLALIEQSPLEEAWGNVLEILVKQLGKETVNSWLRRLHLISYENGILTYSAPTQFIAQQVRSLYHPRLREAWNSLGYEITEIQINTNKNAATKNVL